MSSRVRQGLRAIAGLPVLVAAYVLADFGAYDLAYRVRGWARTIAGVDEQPYRWKN